MRHWCVTEVQGLTGDRKSTETTVWGRHWEVKGDETAERPEGK